MIQSLTGLIHTLAAVIALLAGGIIFFQPKGTTFHRVLGYVYAAAMAIVLSTAWLVYHLTGTVNFLHIFAAMATPPLVLGVAAAAFRRPARTWLARHYYWMSWSYIGLFSAFAAEMSTRVLVPYCHARFGIRSPALFWSLVFGLTGIVVALGARLVRRNEGLAKSWALDRSAG